MEKYDTLIKVLCRLQDTKPYTAFWQYIALEMHNLNNRDPLRLALSKADAELRLGKTRPLAISSKPRQLSTDQLRQVIGKHKERLLPFIEKCHTWQMLIAGWVIKTRHSYLAKVLDALGCPHDGKGSRRGNIPKLMEGDASELIIALIPGIPIDDLLIVVAGLLDNDPEWIVLDSTLERLQWLSQHGCESPEVTLNSPEESPMTILCRNDIAMRIEALSNQMHSLIVYFKDATDELQAGRLPDFSKVTESINSVRTEFTAVAGELRPAELSLESLRTAMQADEKFDNAMAVIAGLERLLHRRNPEFLGLANIYQRCGEARGAVIAAKSGQALPKEFMLPLHALERLVKNHETLDETEIEILSAQVRTYFEPSVATAAATGRLEFSEMAMPSEDNLGVTTEPYTEAKKEPYAEIAAIADESATSETPLSLEAGANNVALDTDTSTVDPNANSPDLSCPPPMESSVSVNDLESIPRPDAGDSASKLDIRPILLAYPEVLAISGTALDTHAIPLNKGELDEHLRSFEAFQNAYWLDPSGQVIAAPWRDRETFAQRTGEALQQALEHHKFGLAFLFVQVLDYLGDCQKWDLDDWVCAEAVSESPAVVSAGLSSKRAQRLLAFQGNYAVDEIRLALFLEAVRPTPESGIGLHDLERIMDNKPFQDPNLQQVTDYLFRGNIVGIDPLAALSAQMTEGRELNREQIEKDLHQLCQQLRTRIAQLWSAAGGKLKTKHCQKAWKKFMEEDIQPLHDQIPEANGPTGRLIEHLPELRSRLRRFQKSYAQVMDNGQVFLNDRHVADKSAKELEQMFNNILEQVERLQSLSNLVIPKTKPMPIEAVQRLLGTSSPLHSVEELCRQLLKALVVQQNWPLRLDARMLRDIPALFGEIDAEALRESKFLQRGLPIGIFRSPPLAVAAMAMLVDRSIFYEAPYVPSDTLLADIREHILERQEQRPDLLSYLPHLKDSSHRNRLLRLASDFGDEVYQAGQALTVLARQCQDLALPAQNTLRPAVEAARRQADAGITRDGLVKGLLLKQWIVHLKRAATEAKDSAIASYRQQIIHANNPALLATFDAIVQNGALHQIPHFLSENEVSDNTHPLPELRRTHWRTQEQVKAATCDWIRDVEQRHHDSGDEILELVKMWINPPGSHHSRQKLRRLFYRWISGEEGIGQARRKRVFPDGLIRGGFDGAGVRIQCIIIREIFRKNELNPTFLPQLADFTEIVLLSPPPVTKGDGIATDWIRSATSEGNNALVVFLAPKLNIGTRKEILSRFHKQSVSAAVIDDFDFWRLAMVDNSLGHDFVPFLEIVMEQLKFERISPFSSQDGQHVRLETYVGRKDEARQLAKTVNYSRVFSGRKLGKSALLKQVEVFYDKSELPSGKRLNVLFVTIAGGDSEKWIVEKIVAEMSQRFELTEPASAREFLPSERFSQFVATFIEQRQQDSLLIILDEADQFVEGQLATYDRDREKSLSFTMMKELPTCVDSHNLPRVRVILSGYRVTHTREGVWANAGDVLRLVPLQEAEAIDFIQGALARIGINIAEHASFIARRCGFQPAILIRFGKSLLNRLQTQRLPDRFGEHITVSHADVADTFNDASIIEEIRTVVNNNFQGNRLGGVIFDALLLAMQELPPGFPLRDAPQQILERLNKITPDLSWLTRIDPVPESEIKRNLRDFMDRELLIKENGKEDLG
ncbi:MAG: hypothetical protein ACKN9T_09935, partial [Candidatus Methylumidiphilus sp.]